MQCQLYSLLLLTKY